MKNDDVYVDALKKKAEGFTATEISEEYSSDGDGNLVLVKRKVNSKYYPPDTAAIKSVLDMEASTKPIEYYDDEELDSFIGRPADSYTDDEAEQFSDVLYTMRQDEVAAWCRSLNLRGIQLPNQIKDEVVMMISDN